METIYLFATILTLLTIIVAIIAFKFKFDDLNHRIDELKELLEPNQDPKLINQQIAEILTDLNNAGYSITRIDPDSVFLRNRVKR